MFVYSATTAGRTNDHSLIGESGNLYAFDYTAMESGTPLEDLDKILKGQIIWEDPTPATTNDGDETTAPTAAVPASDTAGTLKAVFLDAPFAKSDSTRIPKVGSETEFGNLRTTTGKKTREVMVTVDIADKYGHPYTGFIDLTVGGGDDVMFDESNLKTHRAALGSYGVENQRQANLR